MNLVILLAVFAAVAFKVTAPDDRRRYAAFAVAYARQLRVAATRPRPEYDAFVASLRTRTPRLIIVPALVAAQVLVVVAALGGSGSLSDSATLLRWGANLGTQTTNGEWWRLATAAFVHGGLVQLGVEILVLLQLGAIVERLVGRPALAAVYTSGAIAGSLHHIAAHPIEVGTSTSAAIFAVYGLMAACALWQLIGSRRSASPVAATEPPPETDTFEAQPDTTPAAAEQIVIPAIALKRIAVVGTVFLIVSAANGLVSASELQAFGVGAASGLVFGWRAADRGPSLSSVAATCAACAVCAVTYALPLRNIADVKPEVDRVIATEARTAEIYNEALARFARQRITADALAAIAVDTIVPELKAADTRLGALTHVPAEHQGIVDDTRAFLKLRCASWQARADALRRTHRNLHAAAVGGDAAARVQAEGRFRSTQAAAGKAEAAERTASEAFARVKQNYSWRPIAE